MKENIRTSPGLNTFSLKVIMLLPMALDHMYAYLFPRELLFIHYISRFVAPVFAFLTAQTMLHTGNRSDYILRLSGAGFLMAAGNLVVTGITGVRITNNIFLSLAVGAALIYCIDKFHSGRDRPLWLALCALLIAASMHCEGKHLIPLTAVICYYLHDRRALMYGVYIALTGLPYLESYLATGRMKSQFYMIFAVLPMALYNGERGPDGRFAKYFFYIFYPLHVWVIIFIKAFVLKA